MIMPDSPLSPIKAATRQAPHIHGLRKAATPPVKEATTTMKTAACGKDTHCGDTMSTFHQRNWSISTSKRTVPASAKAQAYASAFSATGRARQSQSRPVTAPRTTSQAGIQ